MAGLGHLGPPWVHLRSQRHIWHLASVTNAIGMFYTNVTIRTCLHIRMPPHHRNQLCGDVNSLLRHHKNCLYVDFISMNTATTPTLNTNTLQPTTQASFSFTRTTKITPTTSNNYQFHCHCQHLREGPLGNAFVLLCGGPQVPPGPLGNV
jgi:hypothetical protein